MPGKDLPSRVVNAASQGGAVGATWTEARRPYPSSRSGGALWVRLNPQSPRLKTAFPEGRRPALGKGVARGGAVVVAILLTARGCLRGPRGRAPRPFGRDQGLGLLGVAIGRFVARPLRSAGELNDHHAAPLSSAMRSASTHRARFSRRSSWMPRMPRVLTRRPVRAERPSRPPFIKFSWTRL